MSLLTAHSISLPVMPAKKLSSDKIVTSDILGTAFSIGEDFMLTAGHVAAAFNGSPPDVLVVGLMHENGWKAAEVVRSEILAKDTAILQVVFPTVESKTWFHKIKWNPKSLQPFEPVRSVGYAYGWHAVGDKRSIVVRGFQGHVVSRLTEFGRIGAQEKPFGAYELSFGVPRGLSGSPLTNASGPVAISGLIIGNSETKMLVYQSEERLEEKGEVSRVEQYEALTLGIAVTESEIFTTQSALLGCTIGDHLRKCALVM